jgi:immune inhibitor A
MVDDLPSSFEEKRREIHESALRRVLNAGAKPERRGTSTVLDTGERTAAASTAVTYAQSFDRYVELSREKTDQIFVVLVEFGDERHPNYPDRDTNTDIAGPTRFDGPLHNQIPEPDRSTDNSTRWLSDFSRQHFQDLYFATGSGSESLRTYYERQSSGRYSVDGVVTDWVKVRYNEARYGRSNGYPCASNLCSNVYYLISDALVAWVAGRHAQGATDAQLRQELSAFDQWDRYDYDDDGIFDEPDGYLDRFQIVHAGGDQSDGDPHQGEDALWSHRSYAFSSDAGRTGPEFNRLGGSPIGQTGLWVGDYTMQPENGGLSVFAHEFGHDLGLPDHNDTAAGQAYAENGVNWWSLMGQSRVSALGDNAVGSRAADLSAWDKLQLGWLDYQIVSPGQNKTINLGPHEYHTDRPQAVVLLLPKKPVDTAAPTPPQGVKQWWSGRGENLDASLTRRVTLPATPAALTFNATWDIENCGGSTCDHALVEVDDGTGFTALSGSITDPARGNGIYGKSDGWVSADFSLARYAGKSVTIRFRYLTDAARQGAGFFVDDIRVAAGETLILSDGAENGTNGWVATGFTAVGTTITFYYDNYYIMSNRTWVSFDQYLKSGPYHLGFQPDQPRLIEHFPYQEGLLVSYWDTSVANNNTSQHHGQGRVLPIDSRPELLYRSDGKPWRPRIQGYDAPFSLRAADSFPMHEAGVADSVWGRAAEPVFDDARSYYMEDTASGVYYGVKIPVNGIKVSIQAQTSLLMTIQVWGGRS